MPVTKPEFWNGKRVFLTGHTGFKGGWLTLWLQSMGAHVTCLSLRPATHPNLFSEARIAEGIDSIFGDIRDYSTVYDAMARSQAEIIIHLAAQALVRTSYNDPVDTYATNVMGTVHVLEAARRLNSVRVIINVTSDKCYENKEWVWGYREDETMGGYDPYSNSKACSELVTSAYRRSFFEGTKVGLASVRAGNVIGGGDWSLDRLIPDILRACEAKEPIIIRNPSSIRPWQHVLEPLSGYLMLAQKIYSEGSSWAEAWNFGPQYEDARSVQSIVEYMVDKWGDKATWCLDERVHPHEASYLKLDISKAQSRLGWRPRWSLEKALENVIEWHRAWIKGQDIRSMCLLQIDNYQKTKI